MTVSPTTLRILIVEDEYLLVGHLEYLAEGAGHEVIGKAASASRARAICETEVPDLALVDLHLRDGFTGLDLAQEMSPTGVMVWFVTANIPECETHRHFALGCVPKPFMDRDVVRALELSVAHKAGRPFPKADPSSLIIYRS